MTPFKKSLKHVAGILLATIGVLFVLGAVSDVFRPDPEVPLWVVGIMFVVLGLLPLAGAFALLRATVMSPGKPCPQCGATERHDAGVLRRSQNLWLLHFVGWYLTSLWGASRERQVRCAKCDTLYLTDTRGTRIAGVVLWVFLLLILLGLFAQELEGHR